MDTVALVTGGGSGIGEAIAHHLAGEGYRVAIVDVALESAERVAASLRGAGRLALAVQGDISRSSDVHAAVERVERELGPVRHLVNNAGVVVQRMAVDLTDEEWARVVGVDLTGAFYMSREVARRLLARGEQGAIVNISSVLARVARPLNSAYCASKAGVEGLTRALALEFAPRIRVNAVSPGHILTTLTRPMFTPPITAAFNARIPLGELGQPPWIASVVAFLLSEAARYITGQVVEVDGGYNINGNLPGLEFGPNR